MQESFIQRLKSVGFLIQGIVMNYEQQMRFIDTIHGLGQIRTNNPKIDESIARHAWALNDLFNELQPPKI
jgi:hypothetical protein